MKAMDQPTKYGEIHLGKGCYNSDFSDASLFIFFCIEFLKTGCQGDRTTMYRAFAPFFKGDKGDRRVTKFSREFGAKYRIKQCFERSKPSNSLENLTAFHLQSSLKWIVQDGFARTKNSNYTGGANGTTTCHPPVTLVTLKKGCKRPVYRHSVTLTPSNA